MEPTKLVYLENTYKFENTAKVLNVDTDDNGKQFMICDQTIFYPQGGGQPYDTGEIKNKFGIFEVHEVRFKDGIVYHLGFFKGGKFEPNQEVEMFVNRNRRLLHSRLHSAGHLIDVAMKNIGYDLLPTKGYHFPDGPYVEYTGDIPLTDRGSVTNKLEIELTKLIQSDFVVKTQLVKKDELKKFCDFVPDCIPENKPCRVVTVSGDLGCPCGGTHVGHLHEIGIIKITKIKIKSGNTRVSYSLN